MDKTKGYELLKVIVEKETLHEDYKRVTDLADKYFKLVTGNGIEKLLQRIITRETEEEFAQRTAITKSICPAVLNSTKLPFQKATRKQPLVRKLDYEIDAEKKKIELEKYIGKYWGDKSLEKYMEYAFIEYNYIDPNAFLITEFEKFNSNIEKASPYPFIASSEEAVMFEYKNEILQYLVIRLPITYMDADIEKPGLKYTMYLGNDTVVFSEVANMRIVIKDPFYSETINIKEKYYAVFYYVPKNNKVPAIRFGYIRDTETKGRTFVSSFHCILAYLEKTLKIDSELDMSISMTAFPQRIAFVSPCNGPGCNKGYLPDHTECNTCHGSGKQQFHRGTMDILTFDMPRDLTQMFDLNGVMVTKGPLIELLNFMDAYIQTLINHVHTLLFSNNITTREEVAVAVTATATNFGEDNRNDAIYLFAQHYSSVWEFIVKDISIIIDLGDVMPQYLLPKDFKQKGLEQLAIELKLFKDAGIATSSISAIEDDVNEILYLDRPEVLKEIRIKNEINPFRGYSETNIRFIISNGNTTTYNITLWENLESIFQELELENEKPWLYDLDPKLINEKVKVKTLDYIKRIGGEKQKEMEQYIATQQPQV